MGSKHADGFVAVEGAVIPEGVCPGANYNGGIEPRVWSRWRNCGKRATRESGLCGTHDNMRNRALERTAADVERKRERDARRVELGVLTNLSVMLTEATRGAGVTAGSGLPLVTFGVAAGSSWDRAAEPPAVALSRADAERLLKLLTEKS